MEERPVRTAIKQALSHPGSTVFVDFQHPRPADALTDDQRNTADVRIALTYHREGGSRQLEVASNLYGLPGVQTFESDGSRAELASNVAHAVTPAVRGLQALRPQRLNGAFGTYLPGPPTHSPLDDAQIALIGVARWPSPAFNKENSESNQAYGRRFHATAREGAERIAQGHITTWRQLWQFAAGARLAWAQEGGEQGESLQTSRFAGGYPRHEEGCGTPMGGRYRFVAERVWQWQHSLPVVHNELHRLPHALSDEERRSEDFMSHRVFEAQDVLHGHPVTLTRLKIPNGNVSDFNTPTAQSLREQRYLTAKPFFMEHTDPSLIQPITNHVEELFAQLHGHPLDFDEVMSKLGEIHWWMAHAMPDKRGSAAKTELCIRALAGARGLELPPFQHGIVPDLEAFMTDRETFAANYALLLEEPRGE